MQHWTKKKLETLAFLYCGEIVVHLVTNFVDDKRQQTFYFEEVLLYHFWQKGVFQYSSLEDIA